MGEKSIIERVRVYCRKSPENKGKLAAALGYKTPTTISAWIKKGAVPHFMRENVKTKLQTLNGK